MERRGVWYLPDPARHIAYPSVDDGWARVDAAAGSWEPVSVLKYGHNMFGFPFARILQGRVFRVADQFGILPSGNRRQGLKLSECDILDVVPGADAQAREIIASRWFYDRALPPTVELTRDALATVSEDHPVAVIYTHPGFGGGRVPGCVWFIDYVEDEIAGGALWCPPSELVSEHGSIYVSELLEGGALSTVAPTLSFGDFLHLPEDPASAYRVIFAS